MCPTSVFAQFLLAGPRSRDVLRKLTSLNVSASALPDLACGQASLAHVRAIILRQDLGNEPAFALVAEGNSDVGDEPAGEGMQRHENQLVLVDTSTTSWGAASFCPAGLTRT